MPFAPVRVVARTTADVSPRRARGKFNPRSINTGNNDSGGGPPATNRGISEGPNRCSHAARQFGPPRNGSGHSTPGAANASVGSTLTPSASAHWLKTGASPRNPSTNGASARGSPPKRTGELLRAPPPALRVCSELFPARPSAVRISRELRTAPPPVVRNSPHSRMTLPSVVRKSREVVSTGCQRERNCHELNWEHCAV